MRTEEGFLLGSGDMIHAWSNREKTPFRFWNLENRNEKAKKKLPQINPTPKTTLGKAEAMSECLPAP